MAVGNMLPVGGSGKTGSPAAPAVETRESNPMKTLAVAIGSVLLCSLPVTAQDVPRMETFLGYTFARANSSADIPAFDLYGGSAQFAYNFNRWIGAVVDAGAVHNGHIQRTNVDSTLTNFLAGPRLTVRRWSRITPYFQTLFGGAYESTSAAVILGALGPVVQSEIPVGSNLRAIRQETRFAMTAGGGLDIKINKNVSFRPIQLEYFQTRLRHFPFGNDNSQNNLRYSAGVNFTFGSAQ
jgi:opacity protein-like surface antigen